MRKDAFLRDDCTVGQVSSGDMEPGTIRVHGAGTPSLRRCWQSKTSVPHIARWRLMPVFSVTAGSVPSEEFSVFQRTGLSK